MKPFTELLEMCRAGLVNNPAALKSLIFCHLSNTERVLLEIIERAVTNDDEMCFCSHIKDICSETQLQRNEVRKILRNLRGQLIIELVSTVYEDGGYAGRGYTVRGLNMYTFLEYKRRLENEATNRTTSQPGREWAIFRDIKNRQEAANFSFR